MDKRPMVPADPMEAVIAEDDNTPSDVEPQADKKQAFPENEGLVDDKTRKPAIEAAAQRGRTA